MMASASGEKKLKRLKNESKSFVNKTFSLFKNATSKKPEEDNQSPTIDKVPVCKFVRNTRNSSMRSFCQIDDSMILNEEEFRNKNSKYPLTAAVKRKNTGDHDQHVNLKKRVSFETFNNDFHESDVFHTDDSFDDSIQDSDYKEVKDGPGLDDSNQEPTSFDKENLSIKKISKSKIDITKIKTCQQLNNKVNESSQKKKRFTKQKYRSDLEPLYPWVQRGTFNMNKGLCK